MAKYRLYKNGIYGHRYKGLYISRDEMGKYLILDEDATVIREGISNYNDALWIVDKMTSSAAMCKLMRGLYDLEFYKLNELYMHLINKNRDTDEENMLEMCEKVRFRVAKGKEF